MKTVKAEHVMKSYGSKAAVNDISFYVEAGECFGILGHNGAGKTTLVETVLGLKQSDGGNIEILGFNTQKRDKELYEKVGVQLQQSSYQQKIRVSELCEERSVLYKKNVDYKELLKEFGLADKLKQEVASLSGGERQKLSIILAIMHEPEVIFLDELTTGLDTVARREIWHYLLKLKKSGKSIVLTSHYMDEVEMLCDRVLILKDGKELVSGTVNEVIQKTPYKTMEQAYLWYMGEEELI